MGLLGELIATDQRRTLEFFFLGLRDLCDETVDCRELLYNASILAHYAQVSTGAADDVPAPPDLGAVFDSFVLDTTPQGDRVLMEAAGAQCLLLAGFFEDQMRHRHNLRWYAGLGASYFKRAAALHGAGTEHARLLGTLARHFEPWRQRHARLSRELRDQAYLLALPALPPSARAA